MHARDSGYMRERFGWQGEDGAYIIGRGHTIEQAVASLYRQLGESYIVYMAWKERDTLVGTRAEDDAAGRAPIEGP